MPPCMTTSEQAAPSSMPVTFCPGPSELLMLTLQQDGKGSVSELVKLTKYLSILSHS